MTLVMEHISDTELVSYVNQGDQAAFNSLLRRHQPMIRYFEKKYFAPGLMRGDVNQAGCIGLFVACKRYNPYKGMSFSSFARQYVKQHIINAVVAALRKKQNVLNESISLDEPPAQNEINKSRYELIADSAPTPEQLYLERMNNAELYTVLKKHLTELERIAVLGLMDGLAYKEIAVIAGVGNKSIDNAINRAKGKLKTVLYRNTHSS